VLIDEAKMIIAGHGRVLAARKLGLTDVPVVVATDWTDAKKRAYVIADNKLALNAGWDNELLAVELADLRDVGFDVDLTGFGEDELASLVIDAEETDLPQLASGDREPLQQMTFTLHDEQAATVERAIKKAKEFGPFVDTGNENSNGNALARVCELFLGQHDDNS
jgi:ParB-like chromosome segregation protein Spo0J